MADDEIYIKLIGEIVNSQDRDTIKMIRIESLVSLYTAEQE